MTFRARVLVLLTLALALPAWGHAPDRSPRPTARPVAQTVQPRALRVPVFYQATHRPVARPGRKTGPRAAANTGRIILVPVHYDANYRPKRRPKGLSQRRYQHTVSTAAATQTQPRSVVTSSKGKVCGDRTLRGETMSPIAGRIRGCGLSDPVKLYEVDGVRLNQPAVIDCTTAKALKSWLNKGVRPVVGRLGGGVSELRVVASYACRTRNNQPGAKISEHGKGRAVDISEIRLKNGASLNVLRDWRDPAKGKLLKQIHKSACGPFGTVLGPNSDRFHKDHFHVDTARYRSGSYCR
ncbi:extensin family protein [Actibacterium ureilyticum]|uniref:extensin-like domain-containing protein n=1 Tax=Actibacterium ureilyticum TaxID=1590614 RepID=UPI000BAACBF3|nr:extensin family protein [Actibacterium ureilyticum]